MNPIIEALFKHARQIPTAPAIESRGRQVSYAELAGLVCSAARILHAKQVRRLGIAMDNGPSWATWDLAAQYADVTMVPLSGFFSDEQRRHVIRDAGLQAIVSDRPGGQDILGRPYSWQYLPARDGNPLFPGTAKVTYTSGTTGAPKGVCLAIGGISKVASSLVAVTNARPGDRHLAALPLSVLLENIAGLYVPLMVGACVVLEPLQKLGLQGSSRFSSARFLAALDASHATTCIMVPAMLEALTREISAETPVPKDLRLVAVGGGRVSPRLIDRARAFGLPIYQGYGLSECASVVAFNAPGEQDSKSAGRPLPHVELRLADDGEILVRNTGFLGYLGKPAAASGWLPTGDLGDIDGQGRVHIVGRRKNIFITAFGRNVSPEWIESELLSEAEIAQAVVFGEQRPFNAAVIVSGAPTPASRPVSVRSTTARRTMPGSVAGCGPARPSP